MTTLTAAVNPDGASVTLTLTPTVSISEGIYRTDANGTTLVRTVAGTFPRSTALTITDWEASLIGPVTYTAGGKTASAELPSESPCFVSISRPELSLSVDMVTGYGATRPSLGTVHQGVDRPTPLVALGRLSSRSGTLTVWLADHASALELEAMIDRSGAVFFKQNENPGQDMYLVVTGTDLAPDSEEGWLLNVAYTEIDRPDTPITVWTFASLNAQYATFAAVKAAYTDFEALYLNDNSGVI